LAGDTSGANGGGVGATAAGGVVAGVVVAGGADHFKAPLIGLEHAATQVSKTAAVTNPPNLPMSEA
jgi:hypothetical protein